MSRSSTALPIEELYVTETTCNRALETLAKAHGLSADHPFVWELQKLMLEPDDFNDFQVALCLKARELRLKAHALGST